MLGVINVRYIEQYKLEVAFENGGKAVVDLKSYADQSGVFFRFKDLNYFKQVYVNPELGTLCWPDGIDIAPETLYNKAFGKQRPHAA